MTNDWRKSFDEEFNYLVEMDNPSTGATTTRQEKVKDFCAQVEQDAIERTLQNVGMLRQWLNEDRITDPKKMVTNEMLLSWLSPTVTTKEYPPCTDPALSEDCSGCTDPHSEGTHQGCTKQHGHVGCDLSVTTK